MTGLILATFLTASPGIQLADTFAGRNIRLVDDAPASANLDAMTREQLGVELQRLQDARPGLGAPIALLAVGVPLIIGGGVTTVVGIALLITSIATRLPSMGLGLVAATIVLGVGVVMFGVGVVLAIVGGVTLGAKLRARTLNGREQDEVRRRLDTFEFPAPQPVPPEVPQASLFAPTAMQPVFTF